MVKAQPYQYDVFAILLKWCIVVGLTLAPVFGAAAVWQAFASYAILAAAFFIFAPISWMCLRLLQRGRELAATRIYLGCAFLVVAVYLLLMPLIQLPVAMSGIFLLVYIATYLEPPRIALRWVILSGALYCVTLYLHHIAPPPEPAADWLGALFLYALPLWCLLILIFLGRKIIWHLTLALAKSEAMRDDITSSHATLVAQEQELKRSAQELRVLASELAHSNQELQEFAYVASHDLQEPLRKIQTFSDRLQHKESRGLSAEGRADLERMRDSAQRMRNLIEDLLTLAQVTTRGKPFVAVDLNVIARNVISDLETRVQETGGTVNLEPLPTLEADASQMAQLFQNLIDNAVKFQRAGVAPYVHVKANVIDDEWCEIQIRDAGIGFQEKYLDRIFRPFERLHTRTEFSGTGMGLAICAKIVERHGGNLTARSTIGYGSTFIVTLPLRQAETRGDYE